MFWRDYYNEMRYIDDYYRFTIKKYTNLKSQLILNYHTLYKDIKINYDYLQDNYNLILKCKLKHCNCELNDFIKKELSVIKKFKDEDIIIITRYNTIVKQIKSLQEIVYRIEIYSNIISLNFDIYKVYIKSINIELQQSILRGNTFKLHKLGSLKAIRCECGEKFIDWIKSKKLRQCIIDNGEQPKDDEHPDGIEWKIPYFVNNPYIMRVKWYKLFTNNPNIRYYKYIPFKGSFKPLRNVHVESINEFITDDRYLYIPLRIKLSYIRFNFKDFCEKTYPYSKLRNHDKPINI